ncbi:MAG TPA: hypothetical protein VK473_18755 [Terriglobales bacterium]|nr:hypothetical protein [Terriglobales bacterium]
MGSSVKPGLWVSFFKEYHCYHCGGQEGYVSRPRNFIERVCLRPLFLQPVRCGDCYQRSWRPVNVPVLPRKDPMHYDAEAMVASAIAADRKEATKETAAHADDHQHIA